MFELETERLRLREMTLGDADNLMSIFSDPVAMRYYPGTKDRAQTEDWTEWNLASYRENGFGLWVATLKASDEFAGQCGLILQDVEGEREVEIGYLFLRRLWGQGLATEAARACHSYATEALGYKRLISLIDPGNFASRRVAEKVGMKLEKEIIKWNKPVCVYSVQAA
ncbi:MAG TPA: GNAT family N-acetyltransferase [Blastocatellia bacterium]|nr:GNAT family N-acetyltransferase [Blastocatellia bacterium]